MTSDQKAAIAAMRNEGRSYGAIARELNISENTVKSFCRRSRGQVTKGPDVSKEHRCLCCGIPVAQNPGRKEKKFCSDQCRNKWWNAHLDLVDRKAMHEGRCPNCGKAFQFYGSVPRKYCCHECYVEHRFGGRTHE